MQNLPPPINPVVMHRCLIIFRIGSDENKNGLFKDCSAALSSRTSFWSNQHLNLQKRMFQWVSEKSDGYLTAAISLWAFEHIFILSLEKALVLVRCSKRRISKRAKRWNSVLVLLVIYFPWRIVSQKQMDKTKAVTKKRRKEEKKKYRCWWKTDTNDSSRVPCNLGQEIWNRTFVVHSSVVASLLLRATYILNEVAPQKENAEKIHWGKNLDFLFDYLEHPFKHILQLLYFKICCASFGISREFCLIAPRLGNWECTADVVTVSVQTVCIFPFGGLLQAFSLGHFPFCSPAEPQTFISPVKNQVIFRWWFKFGSWTISLVSFFSFFFFGSLPLNKIH